MPPATTSPTTSILSRRSRAWWVRVYRALFALLALISAGMVLSESIGAGRSTVDFLSYFTIQSNLLAVAVFGWLALAPQSRPTGARRDVLRGGPVLYLAVTGIVVATLLAGVPVVVNPFANAVLHQLMPLVVVADWLIEPPGPDLSFRRALAWLLFPLVWLTYTMIRGAVTGWYPYPFLDPGTMGGYLSVAAVVVGIVAGGVALIWLIAWMGRLSHSLWTGGEPTTP